MEMYRIAEGNALASQLFLGENVEDKAGPKSILGLEIERCGNQGIDLVTTGSKQ